MIVHPVAVVRDGVSPDHIDTILSKVDRSKFENAKTYNALDQMGDVDDSRSTVVQWMQDEPEVREIMLELFYMANRRYSFDTWERTLEVHYLEYHGHRKDKFTKHQDVIWSGQDNIQRKISCSIILSDSVDYEGGEFLIEGPHDPILTRRKGTVVLFPSWVQHEVMPVTSGTRKVLVGWISGPRWR